MRLRMKWLLWILLLVNLIFFSFIQWREMLTGENKSLKHQLPLNVDKIQLLPAQPAKTATLQDQIAFTDVCLEWGEFSGTDSERAAAALATLNLTDKLTQKQSEYMVGYWVYIPPAETRAKMNNNIAELKKLKVDNYFAVQDAGKWEKAISLGIFKSEKSARRALGSIKAKGVKTAEMGELMSKFKLTVFVLKSPNEEVIEKMVTLQNKFAGSAVHMVACD